jgi:hypothetical protein
MSRKPFTAGPLLLGAGLGLTLFAASPVIKATGSSGLALAADTPPAVAQPTDVANPVSEDEGSGADPEVAPADDLKYQREVYFYASERLRDPFGSLIKGRFIAEASNRLPDIGAVELYGVMWGEADKFALVEDEDGNGWVLRVGDPVINGEVAGITRDSLTIRQYFFGTSTTVTLKLKPREDKSNAKNKK